MGWGNAIGAAINSIDSLRDMGVNYWLSDNYAKHQSKQWRSDQKWLLSNANQFKVQDLRKAGLNPVLAVQSGGAMPTAPMIDIKNDSAKSSGSTADAIAKIATAHSARAQARLTDAEVDTQKSIQDANKASASKSNAEAEAIKADNVLKIFSSVIFDKLPNLIKERIALNRLNPSGGHSASGRGPGSGGYWIDTRTNLEKAASHFDENIIMQAINGYKQGGIHAWKIGNMIYDWARDKINSHNHSNGGRNSAKSLTDENSFMERMEWRKKYDDYWDKKRKSGKAFDVIWRNGKPYYEDGREFK